MDLLCRGQWTLDLVSSHVIIHEDEDQSMEPNISVILHNTYHDCIHLNDYYRKTL